MQRDHELLKMANAPKWTSIDPLHRHWKKTLWPTMNYPIPGVVDSGQWTLTLLPLGWALIRGGRQFEVGRLFE